MIHTAIFPTISIEELVIVIPGQRSLPLNDHQFVTTFTNTDIQTRTSSVARVVFSSPRETPYTHHNRQGFRILDLRRYLSENPAFHTAHCRRMFRAFRMCAHGNSQHFCIGRRGPRGSSCNTQRSSSALLPWIDIVPLPCLGFLQCFLCCLTLMGHPQPSR